MSRSKSLAVRIDEDSDLYTKFEEYKKRQAYESTSEALRGILRQQFQTDEHTNDTDTSHPDTALGVLLWDARHDRHVFIIAMCATILLSLQWPTNGVIPMTFALLGILYGLVISVAAVDEYILGNKLLRSVASEEYTSET